MKSIIVIGILLLNFIEAYARVGMGEIQFKLIPEKFSTNELIEFNKDFSENDDPEIATAQLEGIAALKQSLDSIPSINFAVLLFIG
jgi:hypothetical protein